MDTLLLVAVITLITCVAVTVLILVSWWWRPAMWAADLGLPRQEPVAGFVVLIATLAFLFGGAIAAALVVNDEFGLFWAAVAAWAVTVV
ncbi:MAG: hypothetical protein AAF531_12660, partial [Actinomycetota bacterium]